MLLASPVLARPLKVGIVAFQMSSETHARAANAAAAAAKAKGWEVTLLNARGAIPESATEIENLTSAKVDAMILCMTKPVELDAQLAEAQKAGIPVVTIASGSSPHTLFDIQANEYDVGAAGTLYLAGLMNYRGALLTERFEGNLATRIRGRELDAVLAENPALKVLDSHSMLRTASWQQDVRDGMGALLQRDQGKYQGIWASFDGQAFVIDDLLQQGRVEEGRSAPGEHGWRAGDICAYPRPGELDGGDGGGAVRADGAEGGGRPGADRQWRREERGDRAGAVYADAGGAGGRA